MKFLGALCGIWKWRNSIVFETSPWPLEEALKRICHDVDEWNLVLDGRLGCNFGEWMNPRWVAPPRGCIKLNTDGSFQQDVHKVDGCGWCLQR